MKGEDDKLDTIKTAKPIFELDCFWTFTRATENSGFSENSDPKTEWLFSEHYKLVIRLIQ